MSHKGITAMARRLLLSAILCAITLTLHTAADARLSFRLPPVDLTLTPVRPTLKPEAGPRKCRPTNMPKKVRYPNLFFTQAEIQNLAATQDVTNIFKINKINAKYPIPNICDNLNSGPHHIKIPTCMNHPMLEKHLGQRDSSNHRKRPKARKDPCCETKMTITIPFNVVSAFTGETLPVVHASNSFQFIHEATCKSLGARCATGKCKLSTRMHWILVTQNGNDNFVPVSVGNNCYCGTT